MARHKITQSDSPNWRTPEWLRAFVHQEWVIALDAAADATPGCPLVPDYLGPGSPILEDALCGVPWADILYERMAAHAAHAEIDTAQVPLARIAIYCNPPYCNGNKAKGIPAFPIEPWLEAGATAGQRVPVVMLVPHAHQTQWWNRWVESPDPQYRAARIHPFPFRIAFDPPPDYAGTPTGSNVNHALVLWSPHTATWQEPWIPHRVAVDPRPAPVPRRGRSAAEGPRRRRPAPA